MERFVLETPAVDCRRLRATFQWHEDRFAHTIELANDQSVVRLLTSVEGTASDDWPPSPSLQQLHVETHDHSPVGLLVGMAGRNHWSMSVEVDFPRHGIVFDVACRLGTATGRVGSSYRLDSDHVSEVEHRALVCKQHRQGWQLSVLPTGNANAGSVQRNELDLAILPSPGDSATVRWKYRVGLVSGTEVRGCEGMSV